jgi:isocitrate lyase
MIEILTIGLNDRVLGLRVRGSVEQSDLDRVAAALEAKLEHHRPLRIYAEIQDLGAISPMAVLQDLRLAVSHFRDVEREAVVSDAGWLSALARAGDLVPGMDVRAYSWAEQPKAIEWINS